MLKDVGMVVPKKQDNDLSGRLFHIMLLKLPIMLFSNAAKCSLLCFLTFPIIPCYARNKIIFSLYCSINDDSIYVVLHGKYL